MKKIELEQKIKYLEEKIKQHRICNKLDEEPHTLTKMLKEDVYSEVTLDFYKTQLFNLEKYGTANPFLDILRGKKL